MRIWRAAAVTTAALVLALAPTSCADQEPTDRAGAEEAVAEATPKLPEPYVSTERWIYLREETLVTPRGNIRIFNDSEWAIDLNLLEELIHEHCPSGQFQRKLELRLIRAPYVRKMPSAPTGFTGAARRGNYGLTVSMEKMVVSAIPTGWTQSEIDHVYLTECSGTRVVSGASDALGLYITQEIIGHGCRRARGLSVDKTSCATVDQSLEIYDRLAGRQLVRQVPPRCTIY